MLPGLVHQKEHMVWNQLKKSLIYKNIMIISRSFTEINFIVKIDKMETFL